MPLVIDASVAVKWLVTEEESEAADRLLDSGEDLHAPRLMASEIINALWCKTRRGEIDTVKAGALMAAVSKMLVCWNADETISAGAGRLALALDRPVYDCMYLALAYRRGIQLVTADMRFANALAATRHGRLVVRLADYADR